MKEGWSPWKCLKLPIQAYLEILFPATPIRYRYIKLIVNDTYEYYYPGVDENNGKYISIQELEVYVKKD